MSAFGKAIRRGVGLSNKFISVVSSTIVLYECERDEERTYRLFTPEESDPQAGMISTMSPVGKSLLGKKEGDEVTVRTPAGARTFEIKRLTTIHEEVTSDE